MRKAGHPICFVRPSELNEASSCYDIVASQHEPTHLLQVGPVKLAQMVLAPGPCRAQGFLPVRKCREAHAGV